MKLEAPKNVKELNMFLGSIHLLSKFVKNFPKKTDRMKSPLKKGISWEWTNEIDENFEILKEEITEAPCLANFNPKKR